MQEILKEPSNFVLHVFNSNGRCGAVALLQRGARLLREEQVSSGAIAETLKTGLTVC